MKNKSILYPLFTLILLAAVAFMNVQPAAAVEEPEPVTLTGIVNAIDDAALSIVVKTAEDLTVTVFIPEGFDLTTLSLGDEVQVTGTENDPSSIAATEIIVLTEGAEVIGTITAVDDLAPSFTLLTTGDEIVTIFPPLDFDLTTLSIADQVQVNGTANEDGSVNALDIIILYEAVEVTGTALVTAMNPLGRNFTVEIEGSEYIFVPPVGFDWTTLKVGDTIEISGMQREDGIVVLVTLTVTSEGEGEDGEDQGPVDSHYCTTEEVHPLAAKLAEKYGVDPAVAQGWFCEGFGWGQIMLAIQTSQITGDDPSALLSERQNGSGWGQIWQELKLIGKDKDAEPPEDADTDGNGKPDTHGNPHQVVEEGEDLGDDTTTHGKPPDLDGDGKPDHIKKDKPSKK